MLPNRLFTKYSNLKENTWNGTHLLHGDHYYAHWLLTEAINNYSMLSAFCAMHNKDMKLKRIGEEELISKDEFQMKMEERSKKHSEYLKEKIDIDGEVKNRAQWAAANREMDYSANGIKQSKTKNSIDWKNNKGKEAVKKFKESINKDILFEGEIITRAEKRGKNYIKYCKNNNQLYRLIDSKNKIRYDNLLYNDVQRLSQGLLKTSKEKPFGFSNRSKLRIIREDKGYLLGLYLEKII